MSASAVIAKVLAEVGKVIGSLPVDAVTAIGELIGAVSRAPDPARAAKRAAAAIASEKASDEVLKRTLKKKSC